jgi:hypothetical protein
MRLLPALLCCLLPLWSLRAAAQNPIHHCISAQGQPVFTDQPCTALQATPVHAAAPAATRSAMPEPLPILCPASNAQLRQAVLDAFAQRNANRMAGLMLWGGYGEQAAVADIRSLSSMMREPLLDIRVSARQAPAKAADDSVATAASPTNPAAAVTATDPAPQDASAGPEQLILHTTGSDGSSPDGLHFDIVARAGCRWLRNAD